MSMQEVPLVLRNALRQLVAEARAEAALVPLASARHAFYAGVVAAAEDRLRPARQDAHTEAWLDVERPAFREGYLKAASVIAAFGHAPVHLLLPRPPPDTAGSAASDMPQGGERGGR